MAAAGGHAFAASGAVFAAAGVAPPKPAVAADCGTGSSRQTVYLTATAPTHAQADWRSRLRRGTAMIADRITG
jgi:hypothetical protein